MVDAFREPALGVVAARIASQADGSGIEGHQGILRRRPGRASGPAYHALMSRHAGFVVELPTDLSPEDALRRVLDLRAHDRIIPFTRVTPAMPADALTVGTRFVARTSLGPVGFDDPMRIEVLSFVPASASIVKLGRAIRGVVSMHATASARGSVVQWEQSVHLPWLPGFLQPVAARVLETGYRRVLLRLLAG